MRLDDLTDERTALKAADFVDTPSLDEMIKEEQAKLLARVFVVDDGSGDPFDSDLAEFVEANRDDPALIDWFTILCVMDIGQSHSIGFFMLTRKS